ncbi:MAG: phosphomevalonate kinase [Erysipelothrix sp.]
MIANHYPGKLFLMGEYAIMESDQPAIIAAVNRTIEAVIESSEVYYFESKYGILRGEALFENNHSMKQVHAAIKIAHQYLDLKEITRLTFALKLKSNLEEDNIKFGFGSSGVVIVAVIDSILRFHNISATKLELFKLAVIAQYETDDVSSGGDIAACVYGGVIKYERYDTEWLKDNLCLQNIEFEWPKLKIESLNFDAYELVVGWTQKQNKTKSFTDSVIQRSIVDKQYYEKFLEEAKRTTLSFEEALKKENYDLMKTECETYRNIMKKLGNWAEIDIETVSLSLLINDAREVGFASKISGSGGGDCGIAIIKKENSKKMPYLKKKWSKHGILYLDIKVSD